MTPAEKEVERVSIAYHDALVALSGEVLIQTLAAFEAVNLKSAASFSEFGAKVAALIYYYRRKARDIAVAAAQLERALLIGSTYEDWSEPFSESPTLGKLRDNFAKRIAEFNIGRPLRARTHDPSLKVSVDKIPDIESAEKKLDAKLDKEIKTTLRILGEESAKRKLSSISKEMTVDQADRIELEARKTISSNLASGAERISMNGARHYDSNIVRLDDRVVGWARVHSISAPDNPCGWCSMLMSRGAVYSTEKAAMLKGQDSRFDEYHGGCHCIAVKVYSNAQLESARFDKNREYRELWPKVTGGVYGEEKLRVWRKFIRDREKNVPAVTLAPVARAA